jgi:hypothetical protein
MMAKREATKAYFCFYPHPHIVSVRLDTDEDSGQPVHVVTTDLHCGAFCTVAQSGRLFRGFGGPRPHFRDHNTAGDFLGYLPADLNI